MENFKFYFNCFNSIWILLLFLEALLWQIIKADINTLENCLSHTHTIIPVKQGQIRKNL